jgi:transposase
MKADPFSGAAYVFRAKRADRVKLIYWDGPGMCLFAKSLESGAFRWPSTQDGVIRLSPAQLSIAGRTGLAPRACHRHAGGDRGELKLRHCESRRGRGSPSVALIHLRHGVNDRRRSPTIPAR